MRPPRSLIAWLWSLLIFVLCWTPRQFVPGENEKSNPFLFPNFDKVVHFLLFAGFSYFWMLAGSIKVRWVIVAGVAVAILTELGQANSIVGRDASWPDGLADTLGVVAGVGFYYLGRIRRLPLPSHSPSRGESLNGQSSMR